MHSNLSKNWNKNSIFNKISHPFIDIENQEILIDRKISISLSNYRPSISLFYFLKTKHNFYAYTYLKGGSRVNSMNFINNHELIKENNFSGFGFKNNWFSIKICKGRESWGAGENIELGLSRNSDSYDYIALGSDYGKVKVKYIYGILEKINLNTNRYITARGLEWSNKKSFKIGLSETVIYSGIERSFDIGYLNPISSHLEVELNNRLQNIGSQGSNAVWQLHIDYMFNNKIRLAHNYLIDEFVLDRDLQKRKENGVAHSTQLSYSIIRFNKNTFTLFFQFILVGTPTFRHIDGANNFVQNYKPLGVHGGSDFKEYLIGINYSNSSSIILFFNGGFSAKGEENLLNKPYETYSDYIKGSFPSGEVNKKIFLNFNVEWWIKKRFSLSLNSRIEKKGKNKSVFMIYTSF